LRLFISVQTTASRSSPLQKFNGKIAAVFVPIAALQHKFKFQTNRGAASFGPTFFLFARLQVRAVPVKPARREHVGPAALHPPVLRLFNFLRVRAAAHPEQLVVDAAGGE